VHGSLLHGHMRSLTARTYARGQKPDRALLDLRFFMTLSIEIMLMLLGIFEIIAVDRARDGVGGRGCPGRAAVVSWGWGWRAGSPGRSVASHLWGQFDSRRGARSGRLSRRQRWCFPPLRRLDEPPPWILTAKSHRVN
jgi:hypothetical protein